MRTKHYLSSVGAIALASSLLIAAPAFAESGVNANMRIQSGAGVHVGQMLDRVREIDDNENGENNGERRMAGIFGVVTAINGTTLTVSQKTDLVPLQTSTSSLSGTVAAVYTVDASHATVMKNGPSSLSAIAVGDTVMVQGTITGTSVVATTIRELPAGVGGTHRGSVEKPVPLINGNGQPVVGGKVTAISGSTITITNASNVTYSIDASVTTVFKGNATSTLSAVAVGDTLVVQGTVNGSAIKASSIIDQGAGKTATSTSPSGEQKGFFGFFAGIGGFFAHLFGF